MKKIIVVWQATYTTELEVPDGASDKDIKAEIACMNIDVSGSAYQYDTLEIIETKELNTK